MHKSKMYKIKIQDQLLPKTRSSQANPGDRHLPLGVSTYIGVSLGGPTPQYGIRCGFCRTKYGWVLFLWLVTFTKKMLLFTKTWGSFYQKYQNWVGFTKFSTVYQSFSCFTEHSDDLPNLKWVLPNLCWVLPNLWLVLPNLLLVLPNLSFALLLNNFINYIIT